MATTEPTMSFPSSQELPSQSQTQQEPRIPPCCARNREALRIEIGCNFSSNDHTTNSSSTSSSCSCNITTTGDPTNHRSTNHENHRKDTATAQHHEHHQHV